jgi:hypothetical protein
MLRIRDIMVRIRVRTTDERIRIDNIYGSGSYYFRQWPSRWQLKYNFLKIFLLLLFEATFTSFFKR